MEGGMLLVLALSVLAADPQAPRPDPPPPYSVERVKRGLERPPATITVRVTNMPVFRVRVSGQRRYDLLWEEHAVRAPYVRPQQPIYHFEYLRMTTPEALRASTLYPGGISVMPAVTSLRKWIRQGLRSNPEARARREVQAVLKEIQARQKPAGG
jgi:hypothetical protein